MIINTGTELENDIKYIKSVIDKCSRICKNLDAVINSSNKTLNHRLIFIYNQFNGIYNQYKLI